MPLSINHGLIQNVQRRIQHSESLADLQWTPHCISHHALLTLRCREFVATCCRAPKNTYIVARINFARIYLPLPYRFIGIHSDAHIKHIGLITAAPHLQWLSVVGWWTRCVHASWWTVLCRTNPVTSPTRQTRHEYMYTPSHSRLGFLSGLYRWFNGGGTQTKEGSASLYPHSQN